MRGPADGRSLAELGREAGEARKEPDERESPDAGDAGAGFQLAQVEATLDTDQQTAGERRNDAQRLPVPLTGQRRRSACHAR